MSNFEAYFSEHTLLYLSCEQPKIRKTTTNECRPCVVYTSEVFKNTKEIDAYLKNNLTKCFIRGES